MSRRALAVQPGGKRAHAAAATCMPSCASTAQERRQQQQLQRAAPSGFIGTSAQLHQEPLRATHAPMGPHSAAGRTGRGGGS